MICADNAKSPRPVAKPIAVDNAMAALSAVVMRMPKRFALQTTSGTIDSASSANAALRRTCTNSKTATMSSELPKNAVRSTDGGGKRSRTPCHATTIGVNARAPNASVSHQLTAEDIRWTCARLSRFSNRQWHDAFRAARYDPAVAARFIHRLQEKVQMGLMLGGPGDTERAARAGRP